MDAVTFNNKFQNKIDILNENKGEMTLKDYHDYSKENDPSYLTWLLGDHINDWGNGMTEKDNELLSEFESVIDVKMDNQEKAIKLISEAAKLLNWNIIIPEDKEEIEYIIIASDKASNEIDEKLSK